MELTHWIILGMIIMTGGVLVMWGRTDLRYFHLQDEHQELKEKYLEAIKDRNYHALRALSEVAQKIALLKAIKEAEKNKPDQPTT